jgi:SAM-dependent methyltransferase
MAELGSTYFVQDRSNQDELARLLVQDQMVTTAMGGVLPEQKDPSIFHRVLDIACGPGGWAIDIVQTYPHTRVYGIDISTTIIEHARERAKQQQIPKERVEFLVMDALLMLEFPDDFFDLVNFRFGVSFMRQWDWPKMFSEINRILKTDGTVRIVESQVGSHSASASLNQFCALSQRALHRAGHLFKEGPSGLIDELPGLLIRNGLQKIESRKCTIAYQTGTESGNAFVQDMTLMFRTLRPYLSRYGCIPENYDAICQQATADMQTPGFVATNDITTIWAINP